MHKSPQVCVKKRFFWLSLLLIIGMLGYAGYTFFYERRVLSASLLHEDIEQIIQILGNIDEQCDILAIRAGRQPIDFLSVVSFVGSEVGPLNLAYPQAWQGPYMKDNPSYEGAVYDLVTTENGIFVVPGAGVTLPNGMVMGKDILIDATSDIHALTQRDGPLFTKEGALAGKLDFSIGDWDARGARKKKLDAIGSDVQELARELPFTQDTDLVHSI